MNIQTGLDQDAIEHRCFVVDVVTGPDADSNTLSPISQIESGREGKAPRPRIIIGGQVKFPCLGGQQIT